MQVSQRRFIIKSILLPIYDKERALITHTPLPLTADFGSSTLLMRDTPGRPATSPAAVAQSEAGLPSQPQPSQDYLAAVHAMEEGPAELEVNGLPTPGARLQPAAAKAPKVGC